MQNLDIVWSIIIYCWFFDNMHTGGEDRLRNRPFSLLSNLCDLDLDLGLGHTVP